LPPPREHATAAGKEQLEDAGSSVLKTMLEKVEQLRNKGGWWAF
jgi:hypothetical protein